jgi:hypothetical protein
MRDGNPSDGNSGRGVSFLKAGEVQYLLYLLYLAAYLVLRPGGLGRPWVAVGTESLGG